MSVKDKIKRYIDQNIKKSNEYFNNTSRELLAHFDPQEHADFLSTLLRCLQPGMSILEVGAGSQSLITQEVKKKFLLEVVGLDIDGEALKQNTTLNDIIVCDIADSKAIDQIGRSFEIVLSRSVLEHISDNKRTHRNICKLLNVGGMCLHMYPCYHNPHLLTNKMATILLPKKVTDSIKRNLFRIKREIFHVHYHMCRMLRKRDRQYLMNLGYEIIEERYYFNPHYYRFCFPLFFFYFELEKLFCKRRWYFLSTNCILVLRKRGHRQ